MSEKVILITGASSGFGRLAALEASRQGYRVAVTARRAERLDTLVQEIEQQGGEALAVPGNITDAADQQRVIDATLERFGRLDVVVNNAGVPLPDGFADSSLDDLLRQWHTNTTSIIALTKRALPELTRHHGTIINISSGVSRFSVPGFGLYAPSKVAASSITDALRRELSATGVKVCLVEPGPYSTEFGERAGVGFGNGGFDPQDVARAIVSLVERPRRLVVCPWWLRPLLPIASGLVHLLPGPVDLLFWLVAQRQARAGQTKPQVAGS